MLTDSLSVEDKFAGEYLRVKKEMNITAATRKGKLYRSFSVTSSIEDSIIRTVTLTVGSKSLSNDVQFSSAMFDHTARWYVEVLTPGVTIESESGFDYAPPKPEVAIRLEESGISVSWPDGPWDAQLEFSQDPALTDWKQVTVLPNLVEGREVVGLPLAGNAAWFRLKTTVQDSN